MPRPPQVNKWNVNKRTLEHAHGPRPEPRRHNQQRNSHSTATTVSILINYSEHSFSDGRFGGWWSVAAGWVVRVCECVCGDRLRVWVCVVYRWNHSHTHTRSSSQCVCVFVRASEMSTLMMFVLSTHKLTIHHTISPASAAAYGPIFCRHILPGGAFEHGTIE